MATKPPTKTKLPVRKGAAKPSVAKRGALAAKAAIRGKYCADPAHTA